MAQSGIFKRGRLAIKVTPINPKKRGSYKTDLKGPASRTVFKPEIPFIGEIVVQPKHKVLVFSPSRGL